MEKKRQVLFTIKKENKKKLYLRKPDLKRKDLVELKKARRRKMQSNNGARERKSEEEKEKQNGLKS